MGRKKKFIDKKKSATFQLLARDSSDPSFSDDSPGADRVFVRVDNNPISAASFIAADDSYAADSNSIFDDAPGDNEEDGDMLFQGSSVPLSEEVRKEILELGFPDDGYNYLMHLREIKNAGGGSAFYHNPKFTLQHLPRDVKVRFFIFFMLQGSCIFFLF